MKCVTNKEHAWDFVIPPDVYNFTFSYLAMSENFFQSVFIFYFCDISAFDDLPQQMYLNQKFLSSGT